MRKNFVSNLLAIVGLALLSIGSSEVQAMDGVTIGLYRPSTNTFYLRNSNTYGDPDLVIPFGAPDDDLPLAGDWDGNGTTTIGLYRTSTGCFYLRNSNMVGPGADIIDNSLTSGGPQWVPLAGDWDGNGATTIGLYNTISISFWLRSQFYTGSDNDLFIQFFGAPQDLPVVGNWDGLSW